MHTKRTRNFCDHAHFGYKPRPFRITDSVRSEFLGCSNEETNSKSIRTDFVSSYLFLKCNNLLQYFIVGPITSYAGIDMAIRALAPFLAGWGGTCPRCPPPMIIIIATFIQCFVIVFFSIAIGVVRFISLTIIIGISWRHDCKPQDQ